MELFLYLVIAYLIGSIPFGLLLTKFSGLGDIRTIGSGNIGATNVLRTGHKKLAALTLLLDASKGAAALYLMLLYMQQGHPCSMGARIGCMQPCYCYEDRFLGFDLGDYALLLLAGLFAILGHCFPIWLKFKGGKGVATTLGMLLATVPVAGIAACFIWLFSALLFRISSLAALLAMVAAPVVTYFTYSPMASLICLLASIIVWAKHHANIRRLLKGQEPKIGRTK